MINLTAITRIMSEQRGDRFQPHAAVHRLGGEGVPQSVRVHAVHAGCATDAMDDAADGVSRRARRVVSRQ